MSYEVLFVLRVIDKHGDIFPMFLRRAMPMVPQSKMHMRVAVNDSFIKLIPSIGVSTRASSYISYLIVRRSLQQIRPDGRQKGKSMSEQTQPTPEQVERRKILIEFLEQSLEDF